MGGGLGGATDAGSGCWPIILSMEMEVHYSGLSIQSINTFAVTS